MSEQATGIVVAVGLFFLLFAWGSAGDRLVGFLARLFGKRDD